MIVTIKAKGEIGGIKDRNVLIFRQEMTAEQLIMLNDYANEIVEKEEN